MTQEPTQKDIENMAEIAERYIYIDANGRVFMLRH